MKNQKKTILILITKAETGGAQMSVFNLAKKLTDWGHNITVGYGETGFLVEKLNKFGINSIQFKSLTRSHNPIKSIFLILELRKYLKIKQFDAIHFNSTNTLFGALSAKLMRKSPFTVFTFRGLSILDKNYRANPLLKLAYKLTFKFLLNFVDKQVFVSWENQRQAKELKITKNYTTIHNGLDESLLNFYNIEKAKEKISELAKIDLDNKFIIGSIGRLSYQKNYGFLIENFKKIKDVIPNAVCIIIGSGPKEKECVNLVKKLSLKSDVFLLGDIPEAYKYLKAFDLFVLPSRYEGLPVVLIETLFAGTPTINTDINGNKEVIENAGLFYRLDNETEFIDKIKEIINKKKKDELSSTALKRSQQFNIEKTAKKYLEIFS